MSNKRRARTAKHIMPGTQEPVGSRSGENHLTSGTVEQNAGEVPVKPAKNYQELEERLPWDTKKRRSAWLQRPRLYPGIFFQVWMDEQIAKLGAKSTPDTAQIQQERAQELSAIAKQLHWSNEQLAMFTQAIVEYRQNPTIENYLRVRREFPKVELEITEFAEIDALFALSATFESQGIDPVLVAGCMDADEPSIDALCLRLMELLVAREKISKNEPGFIQKRRAAISDTMINYLIVIILESIESEERRVRVPASLVVLIRHLLTGNKPDLHMEYRRKDWVQNLAIIIAQYMKPDQKLSINKLASMAGISPTRAERLLKDEEFTNWLRLAKKWMAEKDQAK